MLILFIKRLPKRADHQNKRVQMVENFLGEIAVVGRRGMGERANNIIIQTREQIKYKKKSKKDRHQKV